jgi:quinolinate synthase
MDEVFEKVRHVVTEAEWTLAAPLIREIRELKRERGALVLAHNYQHPLITCGIADLLGDSLGLARLAVEAAGELIVMCGVKFMAETVKLLNPGRTVLLPAADAGCSLAESITADDVAWLRKNYPGAPVVTYVNTSVAVKAASDACCTSANAVEIVDALGADEVILVPDQYLAAFVARQVTATVRAWPGRCVVHEEFRPADIAALRREYPAIVVLVHPECRPEVQVVADQVGSTASLSAFIEEHRPEQVALITECTMSDNLRVRFPQVQFLQPCSICPYMRRITLDGVRDSLRDMRGAVEVAPEHVRPARRALNRMLDLSTRGG